MPYRKSLYLGGGRVYNVVHNTGYANQVLFRSKDDFTFFVSLLRRELRRYSAVRIVGFCLIPSSYTLLLQEDERGEVARYMHSVGISYGIYFNSRYEKIGKVFQGPYKDTPQSSDDETLRSLCALHALPSSLGEDIHAYEWSSYRYYLHGTGAWIDKHFVAHYFADNNYVDDLQRITKTVCNR